MTRTEERLRDALTAQAAQVRDDRLRPLPEATDPERRRPAWRNALIPVAAAASVLLVIALVVAVTRHVTQSQPPAAPPPAAVPSYFASSVGGGPVEVRSVITGAVIATVAAPTPPADGTLSYQGWIANGTFRRLPVTQPDRLYRGSTLIAW